MRKKMSPEQLAKELVIVLNQFKPTHPHFTKSELIGYLRRHKVRYYSTAGLIPFTTNLCIPAKEPKYFVWAQPEVIHFAVLVEGCKVVLDKQSQYNQNKIDKIAGRSKAPKELVEPLSQSIKQAIAFLKGKGYKVLKPITTFEEILCCCTRI